MSVVPNHMDDMRVCVEYVVDSLKRQEEAMNTGAQSLSSFRQVSWFILCDNRDMGPIA